MVDLRSKDVDNLYEVEIQVGHYSNYAAVPTCGLATKDSIIGDFDEPRYFADPQRIHSEIVWIADGFLEYRIPNYLKANQSFREIQFSLELGSEAPAIPIIILRTFILPQRRRTRLLDQSGRFRRYAGHIQPRLVASSFESIRDAEADPHQQ